MVALARDESKGVGPCLPFWPEGRWERLWRELVIAGKRRWLLVLAMCALGTSIGALVCKLSPKVYYASAKVKFTPEFKPENAEADAERDIRAGYIRFYQVGGIVASAPGVPDELRPLLQRYPSGVAGENLGCGGSTAEQVEYARLYNGWLIKHLKR